MELEVIILSEISQAEKEKYNMISFSVESRGGKLIEQIGGSQRWGCRGWSKWVKGIKSYKLAVINVMGM